MRSPPTLVEQQHKPREMNEKKPTLDETHLEIPSAIQVFLSQHVHTPSKTLSQPTHAAHYHKEISHHPVSTTSMISTDHYGVWRLLSLVQAHRLISDMMI
jgi:hypothetical protein